MTQEMTARRYKSKRHLRNEPILTFCERILQQKDMVRMILSFLCSNWLNPRIRFKGHVFNASAYLREKFEINSFSFNVLSVSYKHVNKIFNQSVNELSHLILSKNTQISINKLSLFPKCRYLQQLYLIQDLSQLNKPQLNNKIDELSSLKLPCLQILQIHYFNGIEPIDINITMENVPSLKILILGVLCDFPREYMLINDLNIDLDIVELRIHYCLINNFDSLRYSLARCSMIEVLCFMSNILNILNHYKLSKRNNLLHALCLLSVKVIFIQTNYLRELSIYAPKLEFIQFNHCELMDKLIILDRLPPSLRSYVTPLDNDTQATMDETVMDIDSDTDEEIQEIEDKQLIIGINEDGISNMTERFLVLRYAKRYNDECKILFTANEQQLIAWPFAYRE